MNGVKITIKHNTEGEVYEFWVKDPDKLLRSEVEHICAEMNVTALFINGKYYRL